jgi:hypothetical protein
MMNGKRAYAFIFLTLVTAHIYTWVKEGEYSFDIFLAVFVALGSTFIIYEFLTGKTMILGKFNLPPEKKGLRTFFFIWSLITFSIGYGVAIDVLPIT